MGTQEGMSPPPSSAQVCPPRPALDVVVGVPMASGSEAWRPAARSSRAGVLEVPGAHGQLSQHLPLTFFHFEVRPSFSGAFFSSTTAKLSLSPGTHFSWLFQVGMIRSSFMPTPATPARQQMNVNRRAFDDKYLPSAPQSARAC